MKSATKTILGFVAVVIVLAVASTIGEKVGESTGDAIFGRNEEGLSDKILARAARDLSKDLPTMVDSGTRLDNIVGAKQRFTYYYTLVNFTSGEVDGEALRQSHLPRIRNAVCTDMKVFIENGVTVRYSYSGNDDRLIVEIIIAPSDCNQ